MKNEVDDLELMLRRLTCRKPPPEFLTRSLEAALALQRQERRPSPRISALFSVPPAIRWALAACWLMTLIFRWNTPLSPAEALAPTFENVPATDPSVAFLRFNQTNILTHELLSHAPSF